MRSYRSRTNSIHRICNNHHNNPKKKKEKKIISSAEAEVVVGQGPAWVLQTGPTSRPTPNDRCTWKSQKTPPSAAAAHCDFRLRIPAETAHLHGCRRPRQSCFHHRPPPATAGMMGCQRWQRSRTRARQQWGAPPQARRGPGLAGLLERSWTRWGPETEPFRGGTWQISRGSRTFRGRSRWLRASSTPVGGSWSPLPNLLHKTRSTYIAVLTCHVYIYTHIYTTCKQNLIT